MNNAVGTPPDRPLTSENGKWILHDPIINSLRLILKTSLGSCLKINGIFNSLFDISNAKHQILKWCKVQCFVTVLTDLEQKAWVVFF